MIALDDLLGESTSIGINYIHIWKGTPKDLVLLYNIFPTLRMLNLITQSVREGKLDITDEGNAYYPFANVVYEAIKSMESVNPILPTIIKSKTPLRLGFSIIVPVSELPKIKREIAFGEYFMDSFKAIKNSLSCSIRNNKIQSMFNLIFDKVFMVTFLSDYLIKALFVHVPESFRDSSKIPEGISISYFQNTSDELVKAITSSVIDCNLAFHSLLEKESRQNEFRDKTVRIYINKVLNCNDKFDSDTTLLSLKNPSMNRILADCLIGVSEALSDSLSNERELNLFSNLVEDIFPNAPDVFFDKYLETLYRYEVYRDLKEDIEESGNEVQYLFDCISDLIKI